ncbi:chitobiase/beta-hexosaminidase C-terminal domain-containing protein [Thalassolituus sp. ST750PaO-4]|nr:chitobiase/beta-hexosaminidase C-terminal domain-containing protein [Thalassolituus sp. ST750PaO-4]
MYTVTSIVTGGGTVSPALITVAGGADVSLSINADDGYQLTTISGCDGELSGNSYTISTLQADCSVAVHFSAVEPAVIFVATPVFNIPAGTYSAAQTITINSASEDVSIRYTLDGSSPDINTGSVLNNGGTVLLTESAQLKAIAVDAEGNTSELLQATYRIEKNSTAAGNNSSGKNSGGALSLFWLLSLALLVTLTDRRRLV